MSPEERRKVYEEWKATLSTRVQTALENEYCGPADCYRMNDEVDGVIFGHYRLHSIDEPAELTAPITCTIIHGSDSRSPGICVFGVALKNLVICDCGKWEHPTPKQVEETGIKVAVFQARRRGNTNLS